MAPLALVVLLAAALLTVGFLLPSRWGAIVGFGGFALLLLFGARIPASGRSSVRAFPRALPMVFDRRRISDGEVLPERRVWSDQPGDPL